LERAGEKAEHGDKIYIMIDTTTTREKQWPWHKGFLSMLLWLRCCSVWVSCLLILWLS
jgi:hypothetical protein